MTTPTTITVTITQAQQDAIDGLTSKGWTPDTTTMHHLLCEKAIGIKCNAATTGAVIWFCIETDGYTHS
jgi:hypothetical protein